MKTQWPAGYLNKGLSAIIYILFLMPSIAYPAGPSSPPLEISGSDIKFFSGHIELKGVQHANAFADVFWEPMDEADKADFLGKDELWLQIPFSPGAWDNPAFYIYGYVKDFEIYLHNKRIIPSSQINQNSDLNRFKGLIHIFSLPAGSEEDLQSHFLYLRLTDKYPFDDYYISKICIGSMGDIIEMSASDLQKALRLEIPMIILGAVLLFAGMISTGIFIGEWKERIYPFLSFGFFSLVSGINYLNLDMVLSSYGLLPKHWTVLELSSNMLLPVGLMAFVGQIFPSSLTRTLRWMWRFHLIFALSVLAWILFASPPGFLDMIFYILVFIYIVLIYISILKSRAGRRSIITLMAFSFFIGLSLIDVLAGLNIISFGGYFYGFGIIIIAISMAYNLFIHYRETRIRAVNYAVELEVQKRKILELEQTSLTAKYSALKSQLNPHFLFNTLGALISLIEEDQELAVDYVQELSNVYRYLLLMSDKKLVSVEEEIQFIKSYYYLVSKRFGQNVNLSIRIPEEHAECRIPPLALQVLLENALKHNIASAEKPLHIDTFVDEQKNLVVRNNSQPKRSTTHSNGIGLTNLENRYRLLTDNNIQIISDDRNFTVKIPLIIDMSNYNESDI